MWHTERSVAMMKREGSGGSVLLLVRAVQSGSTCTGVSVSRPFAGEVVWQVDTSDRTISSFGVPGFGALLGETERCVVLVQPREAEAAGPAASGPLLYFYSGRTCLLRCWRAVEEQQRQGSRAPKPGRSNAQPTAPATAPRRQRTRPHTRRGSNGEDGGGPAADGRRRAASEPRRRNRRERDGGSAAASAEAASRAAAAWARGKDLMAMLRTLGELSSELGTQSALPGPAASTAGSVRRRYRAACMALHPDRHVDSPPDVRALAEEAFKLLTAQYVAEGAGGGGSAAMSC